MISTGPYLLTVLRGPVPDSLIVNLQHSINLFKSCNKSYSNNSIIIIGIRLLPGATFKRLCALMWHKLFCGYASAVELGYLQCADSANLTNFWPQVGMSQNFHQPRCCGLERPQFGEAFPRLARSDKKGPPFPTLLPALNLLLRRLLQAAPGMIASLNCSESEFVNLFKQLREIIQYLASCVMPCLAFLDINIFYVFLDLS